MRCKIAQRLWNKVKKEREQVVSTGCVENLIIADNEYTHHIEEHGCWRSEL